MRRGEKETKIGDSMVADGRSIQNQVEGEELWR